MTCLFCDIVAGVKPAHFVLDEPDLVAFLDIRPVFKGHVLLIPRRHIDSLLDLPAVIGNDFSGIVVESPYESHPIKVGDEVYGMNPVPRAGATRSSSNTSQDTAAPWMRAGPSTSVNVPLVP